MCLESNTAVGCRCFLLRCILLIRTAVRHIQRISNACDILCGDDPAYLEDDEHFFVWIYARTQNNSFSGLYLANFKISHSVSVSLGHSVNKNLRSPELKCRLEGQII